MSRKTATITARVGLKIRADFEEFARAKGVTSSELMRRLVMAELGNTVVDIDLAVLPDQNRLELERFTVWMAGFLRDGVKERANAKGMSASRWIMALVQSNLAREPVLNDKEVVLLRGMNRQLSAIGRNVNQIARALNMSVGGLERGRVSLDGLEDVADKIELSRKVIQRFIRNTQQGWVVDDE